MNNLTVSFIGGGNMARALIGGLLQNGWPAEKIIVSEPFESQHKFIAELNPNIQLSTDNAYAVSSADIVMLAIKPQLMKEVLEPLAASFAQTHPLLISIAAGIRETDINRWAGGGLAIVRSMPNTPALVKQGATGLYANSQTSAEQKQSAESLINAVGISVWVDTEKQLDAVTALSGSGPAYFFLVIEAMEKAGINLGLSPEVAKTLSLQTALGAASLAKDSSDSAEELRRKVTSPGGTTERAINTFEDGNLRGLFNNAMNAAATRADELANELGKD